MSIEKAKEVIENIKTGLEAGHDTFLPKTVGDLWEALALLAQAEAEMADKEKQIADLQAEIKRLEGGWGRVHDLEDEKGKYIELIEQLRQAFILCSTVVENERILADKDKQIADLQAERNEYKEKDVELCCEYENLIQDFAVQKAELDRLKGK